MALFRLPPLVPVDELRQVGRLLRIADYELVLQQLLSSGSLENTRAQIFYSVPPEQPGFWTKMSDRCTTQHWVLLSLLPLQAYSKGVAPLPSLSLPTQGRPDREFQQEQKPSTRTIQPKKERAYP